MLNRRECLKVTCTYDHGRMLIAYCDVADLARYVDLADLCEVIPLPSARASASTR